VIVLGPTGRNFAAGMSGGIAYILDREGSFASRCNTEMVDLEGPSEDDLEEVRALVEEHRERTGSEVAARVLEDWDALRGTWVKVMPEDYKRVLRERAEAAEQTEIDAGVPSVIAEHGDGSGAGPIRAGQGATYPPADGHEEASRVGEAGQTEDAAVAADRAGREAAAAGADNGEKAQIEEEASEEVLPQNG
jgi:hypothetical protein